MNKDFLIKILIFLFVGILAVSVFSASLDSFIQFESEVEKNDSKEDVTDKNEATPETVYMNIQYDRVVFDENGKESFVKEAVDKISGKEGGFYNYQVKDFYNANFPCVAKSDEFLTGTVKSGTTRHVKLYEIVDFFGCTEPISGRSVVNVISFSDWVGTLNCITISNNFSADVNSVEINIYDVDYVTLLGSYTVSDIKIPSGGYLALFPATGEIIGYHGTDTQKTVKQDNDFIAFYEECCEKYKNLLGE